MNSTRYLNAPLNLKEDGGGGEDAGTFEGLASVFGVMDSMGDIVEEGAFKNTLKEKGAKGIKMFWQHRVDEPIGIWDHLSESKEGLEVRGRLLIGKNVPTADKIHTLLTAGALDGLSIGFRAVHSDFDEESDTRKVTEIDLWEVSLVSFPAASGARISDARQVQLQALERIQDLAIEDIEKDREIIRTILLEVGVSRGVAEFIASRCEARQNDEEGVRRLLASIKQANEVLTT